MTFHTVKLPNALIVEFRDQSNRYFGDYWRVTVEVCCRIPVVAAFADDDPERERARALLGDEVVYRRTLEKMGVAGDEVEAVRSALVESFLGSTSSYFSDPSFAPRFVRRQLADRKGRARPFLVAR